MTFEHIGPIMKRRVDKLSMSLNINSTTQSTPPLAEMPPLSRRMVLPISGEGIEPLVFVGSEWHFRSPMSMNTWALTETEIQNGLKNDNGFMCMRHGIKLIMTKPAKVNYLR